MEKYLLQPLSLKHTTLLSYAKHFMDKIAATAEVWEKSKVFLHNSARQQTKWIKRIMQMYKISRKDSSIPEGYFQNFWKTNRDGYSTVEPNKSKLPM